MYWTSGSGKIELNITKKVAASCSHQGHCDNDVKITKQIRAIKNQLDSLNPEVLASELKEYGAWDEIELSDHEQNKDRILWIACGDITETI